MWSSTRSTSASRSTSGSSAARADSSSAIEARSIGLPVIERLEVVVDLVLGVEGQLEIEAVVDVDVGEDPLLAVLDDPLPLDVVVKARRVERVADERQAVAEDVDVDVRALADVARPDAADQPRVEPRELAHQAEGLDPHVAEGLETFVALVHPRHRLDLVADLGVGRQVAGPVTVLDPELLGGLALGGEVFGLGPLVHHLGGEERDLPPDSLIGHGDGAPFHAHRGGAGRDAAAGVAATIAGKSPGLRA